MKLAHATSLSLPGHLGSVHREANPKSQLLPTSFTNPTEKPLKRPRKKAAFAHSRSGAAFMK